jgi:predicted RNA-binding Zn-ribbon protein involved in translation (DUF1610 family)
MGTVMIRCPRTNRAVSTQIDTEAVDFKRLPEVESRLLCPACGEQHVWTAREAWLSDAPLVPEQETAPLSKPAQPAK